MGTSHDERAPIRVLVVEDHRVIAEALSALLQREPDVEMVGVTATVQEALRVAREASPNVILADFRLPDGTGADIAAAVRHRRPRQSVVLLSAVDTVAALLAAVEAGAKGYLLKSRAGSEVLDAVRRAARGEMLIPAAVLADLLAQRGEQAVLLGALTDRERDVLKLMAEGLDNSAVAERLGIRYGTVRSHVRNLIGKLNAHSKMEAVVRAEELGLIER
jgi:two-component system, NarL family, nitrate/nitrite response regulator NarL